MNYLKHLSLIKKHSNFNVINYTQIVLNNSNHILSTVQQKFQYITLENDDNVYIEYIKIILTIYGN